MTVQQVTAILELVAFLVAFVSVAFVLYHAWGMLTHVKRPTTANLLGGLSILFAGLYDNQGKRHRESLGIWFLVALGAVVVGLVARYLMESGGSV